MDIIIGTAGHIDHGKTSLVKALTGVDADRLPEEKQRGITIDLGFAELDLGDVRIGFIDVPGHERFVKNMLAGASGIDAVTLVVAADEGVMPQTREHFDICRLLETKAGAVIITKSDLIDEELLELVKLDVAELVENSFLENAPVVSVSAKTGDGIDELKETLKQIASKISAPGNEFTTRLPIDRSFTVKGFGAVATGTLSGGELKIADEIEILPAKRKGRVRGLQTYGKAVETARAGQRTAVNLGGIEHAEIERGQIIAPVNTLRATQIFDGEIEVLKTASKPLKSRGRVRVHTGTSEVLARVQILNERNEIAPGDTGFVQFRLESPAVVVPNDRFIVRSYSPQTTIAGGKILDGAAQKHRRKDFAETAARLEKINAALENDEKENLLKIFLEAAGEFGLNFRDLRARTGWRDEVLREILSKVLSKKSVVEAENIYVGRTAFESLAAKTVKAIQTHHKAEPLSRGILRETLREKVFSKLPSEIFKKTLQVLAERSEISAEKDVVRAASYAQNLAPLEKQIFDKLQKIYTEAKLEVPTLDAALTEAAARTKFTNREARKIFQLLLDTGEIVKVTEDFYFTREAILTLSEKLKNFAAGSADKKIDVPAFKDLAGISRKYAIPLLEYFDREKITRREGDKRIIL